MAHWIIEDKGFGGSFYECSNCGARWCDLYSSPGLFDRCPKCGAEFCEDEENEYIEDLRNRPVNKEEKEEQTISEYFASFGKTTLDWLKNCIADEGGFMVISRKEYDEMKDEIEKLKKDVEIFTSERDHCIDILRKIGIQDDIEIVEDSVNVEEFTNPGTFRKIVRVSFQVEDY